MRRWLLWLALPLIAVADEKVDRGAVLFRNTCAVAYCHGPEGKPGRAPGFAGRKLAPATVYMTVTGGIPNTSMPAFGKVLKPQDVEALVLYIVSLGNESTGRAEVGKLPPEIEKGRALFFDAGRMGACGSCHEIGERGVPVSLALQDLRRARLDVRAVETPAVVTVRASGEVAFPGVVVERSATVVRVYDLSSKLPVLRTFSSPAVEVVDGGAWKHTAASDLYSRDELEAIKGYLRWMASR